MATPTHIPSLPDVEIQQNAEFDEQLAEHLQLLIERIKETLEVWAGRRDGRVGAVNMWIILFLNENLRRSFQAMNPLLLRCLF
jgi:hypothetical protein